MTRAGNLDRGIRDSLTSFAQVALDPDWRGREREAISQYAFGHLLSCFDERMPFIHPGQIAIEACVPGLEGENPKGRVNKDLVVWASHRSAATWDESWKVARSPRCIIEWTFARNGSRWLRAWEYDINWLCAHTSKWRGCTGYAVALLRVPSEPRLLAARVANGHVNLGWLAIRRADVA